MRISDKGKRFIKGFESCRLEAYICPAGIPTIGYGSTSGVKMGMKITQGEADELFDRDVLKFELDIDKKLTKKVKQHQWDALVSFVFNVGMGNFLSSTLYKKLKVDPDDPTIPNEFKKWCKARVNGELTVLPGLLRRREAEAKIYSQNIYES